MLRKLDVHGMVTFSISALQTTCPTSAFYLSHHHVWHSSAPSVGHVPLCWQQSFQVGEANQETMCVSNAKPLFAKLSFSILENHVWSKAGVRH